MFILNLITVWAVGAGLGFVLGFLGVPAPLIFLISALGGMATAAWQIYQGGH